MKSHLFLLLLICFSSFTQSVLVLPGVMPISYSRSEEVKLKVNKLTSVHTQLPYGYYALKLFCEPNGEIKQEVENIGEILSGDEIQTPSCYNVSALDKVDCIKVCTKTYNKAEVEKLSTMVGQEYRVHWILDSLPVAEADPLAEEGEISYELGFPLGLTWAQLEQLTDVSIEGTVPKGTNFINNHVNLRIFYNEDPIQFPGKIRIVGFEAIPESIKFSDAQSPKCDSFDFQPLLVPEGKDSLTLAWTYSVEWLPSNITWAGRWDRYLISSDTEIHWFSIINSLMIVLFLTGMVAMIMLRVLRADVRRYNQMETEEIEETGWKLVHGDVFRPPTRPMLLSVLVGSGVQVFGMVVVTMMFAVLGFLSPANRGGLLTAGVVLYVVMGAFAGYFATRTYKMFKGQNWTRATILTSLSYPGLCFMVFFIINLFVWGKGSSAAVPFVYLLALMALWFGISVPLCLFGSYFAFKKPVADFPVRTNQIPRQIPDQVWYMHPIVSILMGGILPFGAVFIELFFILTAVWGDRFYYIFGFLFIVLIILVMTSAEITIVMCYFQLCSEDYHWWWRSYLTAGASALYLFLYAIFFYFTRLEITSAVAGLMYFGYSFVMASSFFVLTGSIGFYACLYFVRKIYSQIKVD